MRYNRVSILASAALLTGFAGCFAPSSPGARAATREGKPPRKRRTDAARRHGRRFNRGKGNQHTPPGYARKAHR